MLSLIGISGTKWPQRALGSPLLPGPVPPPARPAPSTQPEAPAATGLCAGASYRLHLDFSIAARNAIFFISIYQLLGILSMTLTLIALRAGGGFHQDRHFIQRYCPVAAGLLLHTLLACRPEQMYGIAWGSLASHKSSFLDF